jgi:pilus assembly protein CpaF
LLEDPLVTDLCIGGDGQIWVDRGAGLRLAGSRFVGGAALRGFATALAQRAGRRLDDAVPFADLPLGGGLRVHVVLPPIAPDGPHLSIRIGARQPFTLDQLVAAGSVSALGARLLRSMVRHRQSFLVTGGAGSGKTTVLATLLGLAEPAERVVLVEDTPELRPALPHLVRLQSRPGNQDGAGQLGLSELVREALRMRPDRIVVGECRGVEVLDLLSALNTGHDGSCATVHANRAEDVPARIEALTARAGLPRPAVHSLLAAGVQAVVHLGRAEDGRRRIVTLGACLRADDGTVRIASAYDLLRGTLENGRAAETLGLEPD